MKTYILTTDRYWPWNGENKQRADRIWNNLDQRLGIPFLVYTDKNSNIKVEKHDHFDVVEKKITFQTLIFFVVILFKAYCLFFLNGNKRFLLGNPIIFRRNARVWYWSYAILRKYLSDNKVDLLIYHGELDEWGMSVSWACRDTGVKAVAWQHGVITKGFVQYNLSAKDQRLPLPSYLFLWSRQSKKVSAPMIGNAIPSNVVGTARITIGYEAFRPQDDFKALICPSTQDHDSYVHFLEENRTIISEDHRIVLKPHPLRKVPETFKDFIAIVNDDLSDVLKKVSVVILSSGTLAVEALRMQIPVIVIKQLCNNRLIPYQEEMPGISICNDFKQTQRMIDDIELNTHSLDRSQFHNTARYYADDLNIELVNNTLANLADPR